MVHNHVAESLLRFVPMYCTIVHTYLGSKTSRDGEHTSVEEN
jgi:hypothetical protein